MWGGTRALTTRLPRYVQCVRMAEQQGAWRTRQIFLVLRGPPLVNWRLRRLRLLRPLLVAPHTQERARKKAVPVCLCAHMRARTLLEVHVCVCSTYGCHLHATLRLHITLPLYVALFRPDATIGPQVPRSAQTQLSVPNSLDAKSSSHGNAPSY